MAPTAFFGIIFVSIFVTFPSGNERFVIDIVGQVERSNSTKIRNLFRYGFEGLKFTENRSEIHSIFPIVKVKL